MVNGGAVLVIVPRMGMTVNFKTDGAATESARFTILCAFCAAES